MSTYQGTILESEIFREFIRYVTGNSIVPSQCTIVGRGSSKYLGRRELVTAQKGPSLPLLTNVFAKLDGVN